MPAGLTGNLFAPIPGPLSEEVIEVLVESGALRIERIVSRGHATPPGEWYDQTTHEWVVLLRGSAGLFVEGEHEPRVMRPGDHVLIPAHRRHRVEWTDPAEPTVWLAVHYTGTPAAQP